MSWLARLPGRALLRGQRDYACHADPATAAINTIALVLAWNGPFYPAYVIGLIGRPGLGSLLTMLASPVFYSVPWIARRNARAGRVALPLIGIFNTAWCVKLFGQASGVGLFFIPCILLAGLLFRTKEVWPKWLLIGAAIIPFWLPQAAFGPPLLHLAPAALSKLASLNTISVATLSGLLALRFSGLLAANTTLSA